MAAVTVFAVEDRSLQVAWSELPETDMTLEVAGQNFRVGTEPPAWYRVARDRRLRAGAAGPGAVAVEGLDPATSYDVVLSGPRTARRLVSMGRTLPDPPGRLLSRFATVSDCHIGERSLGFLHRLHDPTPQPAGLEPYPVRCARAALTEATAWGAGSIVVKGDLTRAAGARETETVGRILASADVPVHVVLGNHDVRGNLDVAGVLTAAGVPTAWHARSVDLPGLRLVLGHSPVAGRRSGRLEHRHMSELVSLATEYEGPVAVVLHHPPARLPVHTYYPPALSWRDSRRFVAGLRRERKPALLLAGHTHRNRRYRVGGLTVSEVGSTKDYPGQWAGYAVHEGGIRQVVRRVARPEAIAWTEMTSRAVGGIWRHWSAGNIDDRCWTLEWRA